MGGGGQRKKKGRGGTEEGRVTHICLMAGTNHRDVFLR